MTAKAQRAPSVPRGAASRPSARDRGKSRNRRRLCRRGLAPRPRSWTDPPRYRRNVRFGRCGTHHRRGDRRRRDEVFLVSKVLPTMPRSAARSRRAKIAGAAAHRSAGLLPPSLARYVSIGGNDRSLRLTGARWQDPSWEREYFDVADLDEVPRSRARDIRRAPVSRRLRSFPPMDTYRAVKEVAIQPIGAQPRQRFLARRERAALRGIARQHLGDQEHLVAPTGDSPRR